MKALGIILLLAGLSLAGYTAYEYSNSNGILVHEFDLVEQPVSDYRVIGPVALDKAFHRSRLRIEMTTNKKGGVYYDIALANKNGDKIWETRGLFNNERDTKTLFRQNLRVFFIPNTEDYYILYKFTAQTLIEHAVIKLYSNIGEVNKTYLWSSIAAVAIGLILLIWGINREMPHRHNRLSDNEYFSRITK